jgi:hypothetical protein
MSVKIEKLSSQRFVLIPRHSLNSLLYIKYRVKDLSPATFGVNFFKIMLTQQRAISMLGNASVG